MVGAMERPLARPERHRSARHQPTQADNSGRPTTVISTVRKLYQADYPGRDGPVAPTAPMAPPRTAGRGTDHLSRAG